MCPTVVAREINVGLNYAYQFVCSRSRVDDLLGVLTTAVDGESADLIRELQPWSPAVEQVLRSATEHDCCVAFGFRGHPAGSDWGIDAYVQTVLRFPASRALLDFHERPPGPNFSETEPYVPPELVDVPAGLSVRAGSEFAVVEIRAWVSDVSRLFERCREVREALLRVALRAGALMLLFDNESDHCVRIYPEGTAFVLSPDEGRFDVADSLFIDVDSWCYVVLGQAG